MRDLGLYVHFPFCAIRCTYCDFNTYVAERIPQRRFTDTLLAEGLLRAPRWAGGSLATVYFGGGTPSLWAPEQLGRVLEALPGWFPNRHETLELTLECNPDDADAATLRAFRSLGIGRLSLGVQSFDDAILPRIGRRHRAGQAREALRMAGRLGFDSVSADLIFGLPGQTLEHWVSDLREVASFGVQHVSLYHLTLEPGTPITREVAAGRLVLPDEEQQADMWDAIEPTLSPFGFRWYEVSNLAVPGCESRHNTGYWLGRPYLGLGPGAHSFLPPPDWTGGPAVAERTMNRKKPASWEAGVMAGDAIGGRETLTVQQHLSERLFTGLRHLPGISLAALTDELGVDVLASHGETFATLEAEGLVSRHADTVALTAHGLRYADDVFLRFF